MKVNTASEDACPPRDGPCGQHCNNTSIYVRHRRDHVDRQAQAQKHQTSGWRKASATTPISHVCRRIEGDPRRHSTCQL